MEQRAAGHDVAVRFGVPCRVENDANAACLAETLPRGARMFQRILRDVEHRRSARASCWMARSITARTDSREGGHVTIDYVSDSVQLRIARMH
jgi:predicted NBD/HSP70 family sugar kinase